MFNAYKFKVSQKQLLLRVYRSVCNFYYASNPSSTDVKFLRFICIVQSSYVFTAKLIEFFHLFVSPLFLTESSRLGRLPSCIFIFSTTDSAVSIHNFAWSIFTSSKKKRLHTFVIKLDKNDVLFFDQVFPKRLSEISRIRGAQFQKCTYENPLIVFTIRIKL